MLLVDSDLRRSHLHKCFMSLAHCQDFQSTQPHQRAGIYITPVPEIPTLTLLPAGTRPPNPAELLGSNRMAELIHQWREEYDHVVIDSAPVLMVSDALAVASRADGTVMIVRAGLTRKKAISRAYELLSRSNIRILGAVINDIDLQFENFYTYSSRGYGYNYYGYKGQGPAYASDQRQKKAVSEFA